MTEPKHCSRCGCYVPDLWDSCPACGVSSVLNDIKTGRGLNRMCNPREEQFDDLIPHDSGITIRYGIGNKNTITIMNGYGNHFIRPTDEVIDDIIRRVDKMYWWTPSKKMDYTKRVLTDRGYTVDEETVDRIQMQVIKWKLRNY